MRRKGQKDETWSWRNAEAPACIVDARAGRELVKENSGMLSQRSEREEEAKDEVGEYAAVNKLWRVARRAFAVMKHLRQATSSSSSLKMRYEQEVRGRMEGAYSYTQACKYDRVGRFLAEFPRFLYQTQFVRMGEWTRVLTKLERLVEGDEFWSDKGTEVQAVHGRQQQSRAVDVPRMQRPVPPNVRRLRSRECGGGHATQTAVRRVHERATHDACRGSCAVPREGVAGAESKGARVKICVEGSGAEWAAVV